MLHEEPSGADLENDAPLLEKSDCPRPPKLSRRVSRRVGLKLVSIVKLLSAFEWVGVMVFIFSTTTTLAAFASILSLWLKPSAWRRKIALDDMMASVVTTTSTLLRAAVAVQATMLIFGLYCFRSPRSYPRFLVPTFGSSPPRILNCCRRIVVGAVLSLSLAATAISSYISTPLLLSDLRPTVVGRPALPFPNQCSNLYSKDRRKICENDPNRIPASFSWIVREEQRWSEPDFSTLPPALFPTFAEYEDASLSARDTQPGVDDTGAIIRALFPIKDSNMRENLWAYDGWATVVNSRVVCVRPTILDLQIGWDGGSNSTFVQGHISVGAIRPSGIHHDSGRDPTNGTHFDKPIPFRCYLSEPAPKPKAAGAEDDWPISLCAVGSPWGQPPSPSRFGLQVDSPFHGGSQPRPYVMANYSGQVPTTSTATDAASTSPRASASPPPSFSWALSSTPPSSPWTHVKWTLEKCSRYLEESKEAVQELDFELHLSLCFPSFEAIESQISATSATNRSELIPPPPLRDSSPPASAPFDSAALLRQLGASRRSGSSSERGIMKLQARTPRDFWLLGLDHSGNLDFTFGFSNRAMGLWQGCNESINYYPHTYGLCGGCGREMALEGMVANGGGGGVPCEWWKVRDYWYGRPVGQEGPGRYGGKLSDERVQWLNNTSGDGWDRRVREGVVSGVKMIDRVLAGIFMDALKREGVGPARALQALFWVLNAGQYYHRLPHFNTKHYSKLSFFEEHVFPVRRDGLRLVSLALGGHFLIVSLVVAVLVLWKRHDTISEVRLELKEDGSKGERYSDGDL